LSLYLSVQNDKRNKSEKCEKTKGRSSDVEMVISIHGGKEREKAGDEQENQANPTYSPQPYHYFAVLMVNVFVFHLFSLHILHNSSIHHGARIRQPAATENATTPISSQEH
jgi:hypothetical protein